MCCSCFGYDGLEDVLLLARFGSDTPFCWNNDGFGCYAGPFDEHWWIHFDDLHRDSDYMFLEDDRHFDNEPYNEGHGVLRNETNEQASKQQDKAKPSHLQFEPSN